MPKISGRDRRAELLQATRELIFTEGASRCTIRRLAERVEVTEAAVYRHFPSKEALLLELLESLFQGWDTDTRAILARSEPASQRMLQLVAFHFDHFQRKQFNPVLLLSDAIAPEQTALRGKLQTIAEALYLALLQLLSEGCAAGEFATDLAVETAAVTVLGVIQSTILQWALYQQPRKARQRLLASVIFLLDRFQPTPTEAADGRVRPGGQRKTRKEPRV